MELADAAGKGRFPNVFLWNEENVVERCEIEE